MIVFIHTCSTDNDCSNCCLSHTLVHFHSVLHHVSELSLPVPVCSICSSSLSFPLLPAAPAIPPCPPHPSLLSLALSACVSLEMVTAVTEDGMLFDNNCLCPLREQGRDLSVNTILYTAEHRAGQQGGCDKDGWVWCFMSFISIYCGDRQRQRKIIEIRYKTVKT